MGSCMHLGTGKVPLLSNAGATKLRYERQLTRMETAEGQRCFIRAGLRRQASVERAYHYDSAQRSYDHL